jgi:para-nitrobenzyl esterase
MSDTSRREFLSGAATIAGVSTAAAAAGAVPAVAFGAVRENVGKSVISTPESAIVETSVGKVRGFVRNGIFTFKGIPYAGTTAGEARFQPPAPLTPWTQVRATMSYGPVCPQPVRGGWAFDRLAFLFDWDDGYPGEDCLRLNVWTPVADDRGKRPVMVWLHGGGYEAGSSQELPSYDGENLSRRGDVVVVSINHRLNVFGYLNMAAVGGEKYSRAVNVGMLDIVAALQWVRDNVGRFGGDPGNVTIFGESAGGLSVSALLVSPITKGLFHKAIIESGSGAQLTTLQQAERAGEALVKQMGLEGAPNLLATLRAKPWTEIPDAQNYRGSPVLDGYAFTQHPRDAWAKGQQANVPMIVGYNLHEATFFTGRDGELPETLGAYQKSVRDRFGAQADQILRLYPATTDQEAYWADVAIRTDQRMGLSARAQLRGMFSVTAKTWEYHFTYLPDVNKDSKRGVSHATELAYVFGTVPPTSDKATRDVSNAIMNYWTQFAKTGDPNQSGLPAWPVFAKGRETFLDIGRAIQPGQDLTKEKLDLLESIQRTRDTTSTGR